jgi:hypothetical protein
MDYRLADAGYQCRRKISPEETHRDEARSRDSHCWARRQRSPRLGAFCRGLEDLGYDTLWVGDRLVTPVDVDSSYLARGPQMTRSLRAAAPRAAADHPRRAQRRPP